MREFSELRVFVADRQGRSEDLSLVTGSVMLTPKEGAPFKRDLQLMMPDPAEGAPSTTPRSLPDGRQLRLELVDFPGPFRQERRETRSPSVYLKADLPAEMARSASAKIVLQFGDATQELDLPSLSGK
jgi:hypothetical protein